MVSRPSFMLLVIVLLLGAQTFHAVAAETKLFEHTAEAGTQFTTEATLADYKVAKGDTLFVRVGLSVSQFGENVEALTNVLVFAKIDKGAYLDAVFHTFLTQNITTTGWPFEAMLQLEVENEMPEDANVYVRVAFSEDLPDQDNPVTDTGWIYAFSLDASIWARPARLLLLTASLVVIAALVIWQFGKRRSGASLRRGSPPGQSEPQQPEAADIQGFCSQCGAGTFMDSKFCRHCGASLGSSNT